VWEHYFDGFFARLPQAEEHHGSLGTELGLMALVTVLALGAMYAAYMLFSQHRDKADKLGLQLAAPKKLLANKYYMDEIYEALVVRPTHYVSKEVLWKIADVKLIDGAVNGAATLTRRVGSGLRLMQNGIIENYAVGVAVGAMLVLLLLVFI